MNALRTWLDAERGRLVSLASEIGVTPAAISQWANRKVPSERLWMISDATGIPVKKLRPDIVTDGAQ